MDGLSTDTIAILQAVYIRKSGYTIECGSFPTYVQTNPAKHHQMNRLRMIVLGYDVGMSKSKARRTHTLIEIQSDSLSFMIIYDPW